jgi:PEP-CTERM motif
MLHRLAAVAALVTGFACASAAADTVTISDFKWGAAPHINTSMSGTVGVGQFKGKHDGVDFVTYCTDIYEHFHWNTTYTNYFVAPNGSTHGFTSAQATLLGKLYTVADALVDTADEAAAFQLAIWEALYDSSPEVSDVTGRGTFYVQGGGNLDHQTLANQWLAQAGALGSSHFNVVRLASVDAPRMNDGRQDFILVSKVPEPATPALMLAGLAGLGLLARRRRT